MSQSLEDMLTKIPPFSLYIHFPWCIKKCPYCDFNSHNTPNIRKESDYIDALLDELDKQHPRFKNRRLISIFLGGGTPSLFSGHHIAILLNGLKARLNIQKNTEITLEANPGVVDQAQFYQFRESGINRLSLGVQSFQEDKLNCLGRIHNKEQALSAFFVAHQAGFEHINIDLMYGLPKQSVADALYDLNTALLLKPSHLSWYQLTVEPNTLFYHHPPTLPKEDQLWHMQKQGHRLLKNAGFKHYEVSAYACNAEHMCTHNRHYWEFGDYLGIGAGAHSKWTDDSGAIQRRAQVKHPNDYLNPEKRDEIRWYPVECRQYLFEFMLNTQRLIQGVPSRLLYERTGISLEQAKTKLMLAYEHGFLHSFAKRIRPTKHGKRFLNDFIALFLE